MTTQDKINLHRKKWRWISEQYDQGSIVGYQVLCSAYDIIFCNDVILKFHFKNELLKDIDCKSSKEASRLALAISRMSIEVNGQYYV